MVYEFRKEKAPEDVHPVKKRKLSGGELAVYNPVYDIKEEAYNIKEEDEDEETGELEQDSDNSDFN